MSDGSPTQERRPKSTAWKDTRAKRPGNASAIAKHVAQMEASERAYRLREAPNVKV